MTTISHYCLKCKLLIEEMEIEEVVKAETSNRYYAIGTCPSCGKKQKRPIKKELALSLLGSGSAESSPSPQEGDDFIDEESVDE